MRRTRQIGHHHRRQSVDHFSDIDDRDTREWLEPDMEDDFRDYAYRDEPYVPRRLRHQVLVDGRLVDSWTEPVEGTRWERHARDFDARHECHHPPPPPPPRRHPFEEVLDWLEGLVGGRHRLDLLDDVPLEVPSRPVLEDPSDGAELEAVERLLDSVAAQFFGDDARPALRQALLHVWNDSPDLVLHAKSAPHAAGGICWAVARANGWFHPHTNVRQKEVQRHLWLTSTISAVGGPVVRALRDLGPRPGPYPTDYPDLLALGHPDLLTATTRLQLIGWRDKATAARDAYGPPPADGATMTTGGRLS